MALEDIINKVAADNNISKYVAMRIWRSQFHFMYDKLQECSGASIRLPYWGIYSPKPNKVDEFKKISSLQE